MSSSKPVGIKQQLSWVLLLGAIMLVIQIANMLSGYSLNQFALIPRSVPGLAGILTSPFLHGSGWHFLSNILPFCIFSFLLLQYGVKQYIRVSVCCILATGILVWAFARPAAHVGASGLIYGYFGYLLLAGFFSKRLKLALISLIVGFGYGGLVWGILPVSGYISWESHLAGLISGLVLAVRFRKYTQH